VLRFFVTINNEKFGRAQAGRNGSAMREPRPARLNKPESQGTRERGRTGTGSLCYRQPRSTSNRELDLLESALIHCKQGKASGSHRELWTNCNPPIANENVSQNPQSPANIFQWSRPLLADSDSQTEIDVTPLEQTTEGFLTEARTVFGDLTAARSNHQGVKKRPSGFFFYLSVWFLVLFAFGSLAVFLQGAERLDRDALLGHLNAVINWYRDATSKVQTVGLPSDAIYQDNAQNLAAQVVRLAFESAKAEAQLITAANSGSEANQSDATPTQEEKLAQFAAQVKTRIQQDQTQLAALDNQIAAASGSKKKNLADQREKVEGDLELANAMQDAVQRMTTFVESNSETSTKGLQGSVNELARSVPEVLGTASSQNAATKAAISAQPISQTSGGLAGDAKAVYDQMRSIHQIDQLVKETGSLRDIATNLQKPLRANLAETVQHGRELSNLSATTGAQAPQATPQEFQALTNQFKRLSSALIPLNQEIVLLDESRANLLEWRRALARESGYVVRSLLTRVLGLALALGFVFALSEAWRRLTFRYISDMRRRRQFLILRRFVVGFLIVIVILMGFISEFSSLATFAGFVTAGIAVGLQAVLLSVAAYFFVVGRYGISVGDRISIAGVTGDVIDIGLVRMYLVELAGTGIELYPTGRIVVFSNAVLFQPATPLYKQIPGTSYAWHEVAVSLAPGANYKLVQDKLTEVVNSVYAQYRPGIEKQYGDIERHVEIELRAPETEAKLQFVDTGLELMVRYPLEIRKAPEVDDNLTRKLLEVIDSDPDLKAAVLGSPRIRAAVRG
jgi:small-conductance mechanosensitive channel